MKRKTAIVLSVLLICLSIMPAYAVMDQESFYKMGISALTEMTLAQAQQAVNYFDKAGNHLEAKNYKQYAQSLFEILQLEEGEMPDLEMTGYRLQKLESKQSFTESLSENGLPSCDDLMIYIDAWKLENAGDYAGAWHLYEQIEDVLDAYDREFDLTDKAYEQGKAAYEKGDYETAAAALQGLEWRDSETLYQWSAAKTYGFDVQWNAARKSWDVLFDERVLPTVAKDLMREMEEEFGEPTFTINDTDELWLNRWYTSEANRTIRFRGICLDNISVCFWLDDASNTLSGTISLFSEAIRSEEMKTTLKQLHEMLREYDYRTTVYGNEIIMELNLDREEDLNTLLDNKQNFDTVYMADPGAENQEGVTLFGYLAYEEECIYQFGVSIPLP